MEFTPFINLDDIKARGYDFLEPGVLETGAFGSEEEAANDLIQECFDTIYNLIEEHNGVAWTLEFFNDMAKEINPNEKPKAYLLQQALKWVLINHVIFIHDNGDKDASAKVNNERLGISPKSIKKLYNVGILEC